MSKSDRFPECAGIIDRWWEWEHKHILSLVVFARDLYQDGKLVDRGSICDFVNKQGILDVVLEFYGRGQGSEHHFCGVNTKALSPLGKLARWGNRHIAIRFGPMRVEYGLASMPEACARGLDFVGIDISRSASDGDWHCRISQETIYGMSVPLKGLHRGYASAENFQLISKVILGPGPILDQFVKLIMTDETYDSNLSLVVSDLVKSLQGSTNFMENVSRFFTALRDQTTNTDVWSGRVCLPRRNCQTFAYTILVNCDLMPADRSWRPWDINIHQLFRWPAGFLQQSWSSPVIQRCSSLKHLLCDSCEDTCRLPFQDCSTHQIFSINCAISRLYFAPDAGCIKRKAGRELFLHLYQRREATALYPVKYDNWLELQCTTRLRLGSLVSQILDGHQMYLWKASGGGI